jgi:uncharacterized membrane protein (UPF0182 family)
VTLYEWDEEDPILKAWTGAFPGIVESKESIPDDLRAHMRYPEDLFKVQRSVLAQYHVTAPRPFYEGSDRWRVPEDPTKTAQSQPPYRLSVRTPGSSDPVFSLTSVYVPQNRQNLASFISVDADAAGEEYGTIRILRLPSSTQIPGPSQIANQFGADEKIQNALLAFTRTNSKALYGNLLTLPVGDGLLYVQPLYTLREAGEGTYPVLRYVLVSFGKDVGYGPTLASALDNVLGVTGSGDSLAEPGEAEEPPPGEEPSGGELPNDVASLLAQAEEAFAQAEQALQDGDLAAYGEATERARDLVAQAIELSGASPGPAEGGQGGGSGGGSGGGGGS